VHNFTPLKDSKTLAAPFPCRNKPRSYAAGNFWCEAAALWASPKAKATIRDWFRARMYDLSV
jgi:hypothetical protein